MVLPMEQHEILSRNWTSTIARSAGCAGLESTVSASEIVTQRPNLPSFLEPIVNLCPPLPPQLWRCGIHSSQSPMSFVKCESQTSALCRGDLLLNRICGGGDFKCRISDKAAGDSFTALPRFRPYLQFPESAVRFERPRLEPGVESNAGSDIDIPNEIHDDPAEHSMAAINPSPENTSYIDVAMWDNSPPDKTRATSVPTASRDTGKVAEHSMAGINPSPRNTSYIDVETWDSSPPDMIRATSARTESRDTGEVDEHTRLEDSADDHNDRPDKPVARAQRVIEKDARRCPEPRFSADFQDFAYQQAQPSDPYSGSENVELRSQGPPIASTPSYMIPPANAVGPPLPFEDAGRRGRRYGSAPSFYDAIYSDAAQAANGHTMPLRLKLPPLTNQDYHLLDQLPATNQFQQFISGPPGLNEQYHRPVVENQDAVPRTRQRNIRRKVPRPHHHTSFPISPAATLNISNSILPPSLLIDPSTGACAGPGFCTLPPPHAHYTPQNVLPRPLTIGEVVDFSTAQLSLSASNPQTHALAVGLSQWQQNATRANLTHQLQGRTLPVPQNTALIAQLGEAPYALRQQWLLRSQLVTPQMNPTLTPYQSALPPQNDPSGVLPQGRGRKRVIESRDPPAPRRLGYFDRKSGEVKWLSVGQ